MCCPLLLAETPQSRRQQKTGAPASLPRPRRHAVVLKLGIKPKSKDVFGSFQLVAGERSRRPRLNTEPHQNVGSYIGSHLAANLSQCALSAAWLPALLRRSRRVALFEPQGDGRVAAVIDARSFRLEDGREVVLAGIEPVGTEKSKNISALSAIVAGREVTLSGQDDTPDRYGRQPAFAFLAGSQTPVQAQLLAQGAALVSGSRDRQGVCLGAGRCRSRRPRGQIRRLGRSVGHKKRGKSGRYFGRDRAIYGGRGQGFVRQAGRGNDLSELRTELDTGLCRDYFKAHAAGFRGWLASCLSPSKTSGFASAAGSRRVAGRESKCSMWGRSKCWGTRQSDWLGGSQACRTKQE